MNTALKVSAAAFLLLLVLGAVGAPWFAPAGYAEQFRESPLQPPGGRFLLGTDELGRDLLARTLYGTRISLLLAAAAAALCTLAGSAVGVIAGCTGGFADGILSRFSILLLSLPWMFLVLAVRAALPLDLPPEQSVWITFAVLAAVGWAAPAQVIAASARGLRRSDFAQRARAEGGGALQILFRQIAPNLRTVVFSQFLALLPAFVLSEATLSLLGLGVADPLPSWGGLLRGLEDPGAVAGRPWRLLPLLLLLLTTASMQILGAKQVHKT
jgi:peptide/nickel transport system permease protein